MAVFKRFADTLVTKAAQLERLAQTPKLLLTPTGRDIKTKLQAAVLSLLAASAFAPQWIEELEDIAHPLLEPTSHD